MSRTVPISELEYSDSAEPNQSSDHNRELPPWIVRAFASLILLAVCALAYFVWLSSISQLPARTNFLLAGTVAFLSLRVHSAWTVLILLIMLGCCHSSVGNSANWTHAIFLSVGGGMLLLMRANFNSIRDSIARLLQFILDARTSSQDIAYDDYYSNRRPNNALLLNIARRQIAEILLALLMTIVTSTLAAVLLSAIPLRFGDPNARFWSQISADQIRPNPTILILLLGIFILLREWDWRQLNRDQAQIAIRAESMRWKVAELKRVIYVHRRLLAKRGQRPRIQHERGE